VPRSGARIFLNMTISVLFLGLLLGLQHAFEADHVAAVTSMHHIRSESSQNIWLQLLMNAGSWGVGHGLVLLVAVLTVYFFGVNLPESARWILEISIGFLICYMGIRLFSRATQKGLRFHTHTHQGGVCHTHAFLTETREPTHYPLTHKHPPGLPLRSLLLGMLHGAAGSGALLVLTAATAITPTNGLIYVCVFSLGALTGMVLISSLIAWPLARITRFSMIKVSHVNRLIGFLTLGIGVNVLYRNLALAF